MRILDIAYYINVRHRLRKEINDIYIVLLGDVVVRVGCSFDLDGMRLLVETIIHCL